MQHVIAKTLAAHIEVIQALDRLAPDILTFAERAWSCLANGGRLFWMGNGGSAADSQHLAAELVGRFERERLGLASIALTTDSSVLTAVANATLLNNLAPVWVALLAALVWRQRLGGRFWLGLALACIGAAIVLALVTAAVFGTLWQAST